MLCEGMKISEAPRRRFSALSTKSFCRSVDDEVFEIVCSNCLNSQKLFWKHNWMKQKSEFQCNLQKIFIRQKHKFAFSKTTSLGSFHEFITKKFQLSTESKQVAIRLSFFSLTRNTPPPHIFQIFCKIIKIKSLRTKLEIFVLYIYSQNGSLEFRYKLISRILLQSSIASLFESQKTVNFVEKITFRLQPA